LCKERNVDGAVLSGLRVNDPYLQEVVQDTDFPCVLIDIPAFSENVSDQQADFVKIE
jgi:LacI family transcriptional regulator